MLAPEKTRIDWWISTRDTIFFCAYLGVMSYFMANGEILPVNVYVLLIMYIIHVMLMKFNHTYEVALKRYVAHGFEVRELNRLANEDIQHFHYNLDSRFPSIEVLNKIHFKQEGDVLVFDAGAKLNKTFTGPGQFMAK